MTAEQNWSYPKLGYFRYHNPTLLTTSVTVFNHPVKQQLKGFTGLVLSHYSRMLRFNGWENNTDCLWLFFSKIKSITHDSKYLSSIISHTDNVIDALLIPQNSLIFSSNMCKSLRPWISFLKGRSNFPLVRDTSLMRM